MIVCKLDSLVCKLGSSLEYMGVSQIFLVHGTLHGIEEKY
jgi:hypothetical protein